MRAWLSSELQKPQSLQNPWFRGLTWSLSRAYKAIVRYRGWRFDSGRAARQKLPGITISIGNLAVGGTGKSPITIALAAELRRLGARPAILSRGYGTRLESGDSLALLGGKLVMRPCNEAEWSGQLPDEARMASADLPEVPIVVGPKRFAAAHRYLQEGPGHGGPAEGVTHWILDDGFQHRQLSRDVDIVLLDAARPFGNGALLPSGSLREPIEALKRADIVVFTRCLPGFPRPDAVQELRTYFNGPVVQAYFENNIPASLLQARAGVLLAVGIAHPERLKAALSAAGVAIAADYIVGDHEPLSRQELLRRASTCDVIVTTAKDHWRDPMVFANLPKPLHVLELVVRYEGEPLAAVVSTFNNKFFK